MYRVERISGTGIFSATDFLHLEDAVQFGLRLRHMSYDVEIVDPETGDPVEM